MMSGVLAAKAAVFAKERGDYSASGLAEYKRLLAESFVLKDLAAHASSPEFMETPGLYGDYPRLAEQILKEMFTVDGSFSRPMFKKVLPHLKKAGVMRLLKDAWKGRAL